MFDVIDAAGLRVGNLCEVGVGRTGGSAAGVVVGVGISRLVAARIGHGETLAVVVIGEGGVEGGAAAIDPAGFLREIAAITAADMLHDS